MTVKTKTVNKKSKLNIDKIDSKKIDKIANILCPSYEDYADELSILNPRKNK